MTCMLYVLFSQHSVTETHLSFMLGCTYQHKHISLQNQMEPNKLSIVSYPAFFIQMNNHSRNMILQCNS